MTIHYHGTPLTPLSALYQLAGRHFCVSHARPDDVERAHQIGQSVMIDNGAFSHWQLGTVPDWRDYACFCERWLQYPTSWCVIPDVIGGSEEENDHWVERWRGVRDAAPVWHMHESLDRLLAFTHEFSRVCIGSSNQYALVLSPSWERRMDEVWNYLFRFHSRTPYVHMMRGMNCAGLRWPFASLDSTDVARNHNRLNNTPSGMAARWDAMQCPPSWRSRSEQQMELVL